MATHREKDVPVRLVHFSAVSIVTKPFVGIGRIGATSERQKRMETE